MHKLTLGKSTNNNIVFNKTSIEDIHIEIDYYPSNELVIKDKSESGTFVNGRKIRSKLVLESDMIILGEEKFQGNALFKKVKSFLNSEKIDFKAEFKIMKDDFLNYEKQLSKIQNNSQLIPTIIKSFITIAVIVGISMAPEGLIPEKFVYPLIICAGIIGTLLTTSGKKNDKKKDQLSHLKLDYEKLLVCPKCETSLMNERLAFWEKKGSCKNCNASWMMD